MSLLDLDALARSPVVANNAMNRERELSGTNGYAHDLKLDVLGWLAARARERGEVAWLDLCCGSGRALVAAAGALAVDPSTRGRASIVGVDLVASHDRRQDAPGLRIVEANLERWAPDETFDIITCVHGLHYVGDKLGLMRRALGWLSSEGLFVANLDLVNLRLEDGRSAARRVTRWFRQAGLRWCGRDRIISAGGPPVADLDLEFVGADDAAGPNSTGQPAVSSLYRVGSRASRRRGGSEA